MGSEMCIRDRYNPGFDTTQTTDIRRGTTETSPGNTTIPIGPGREQADRLSGQGLQMIPELSAITDMILPVSPRTVMFDLFDNTVSLFSMTDASFFELENDAIENSLVLGNVELEGMECASKIYQDTLPFAEG